MDIHTEFSERVEVDGKPAFKYKLFTGTAKTQIPLILTGNNEEGNNVDIPRTVITPKQLIHERLHGTNDHDREILKSNNISTACLVIPYPVGDTGRAAAKYVFGHFSNPVVKEYIDTLPEGIDSKWGNEIFSVDQYEGVVETGGLEFIVDHAYVPVGDNLDKIKAFWTYLLEGDIQLLEEYEKKFTWFHDDCPYEGDDPHPYTTNQRIYFGSNEGTTTVKLLPIGKVDETRSGNYRNLEGNSIVRAKTSLPVEQNLVATIQEIPEINEDNVPLNINNKTLPIEAILDLADEYIPPDSLKKFKTELRKLYK